MTRLLPGAAPLLLLLLLLPLLLMLNLASCATEQEPLAAPAQVRFDSVDYINILNWTPSTDNRSLQYYVQWKIYGEQEWLDVAGCQGIRKHHCDLTDLTSNPRENYYARVHAVHALPALRSAWALSPRFSPRWDTKLSAPAVRVNATERRILVIVKPPLPQLRKNHNNLLYRIYLIHADGEEEVSELSSSSSNKLQLKGLKKKTRYCVQVQTVVPFPVKSSGRSSLQCVTTH